MSALRLISQGAEASVYETSFCDRPCVLKRRTRKSYRHPTLDVQLQQTRTVSVSHDLKFFSNFSIFFFFKGSAFVDKMSSIGRRDANCVSRRRVKRIDFHGKN
jgi:hypothetical protein